jgi:hypothetical protein
MIRVGISKRLVAAVAVVGCLIASVIAADKIWVPSRGSGKYKLDGETRRIVEASLLLGSDRGFLAKFECDDRTTIEFAGRHSGEGYHRELKLMRGLDKKELHGSGEMTLANNHGALKDIRIEGEVDDRHFVVKFEASKIYDDKYEERDEFSFADNIDGKGRLEIDNERSRVTRMRLKLARNGDATIVLEGNDIHDERYEGRWSGAAPDIEIELRHHESLKVRAKGKLTLTRNGRGFKSIDVEGKEDGQFFRLTFEREK